MTLPRFLLQRSRAVLSSSWLRPLNDPRHIDAVLTRLHPLWSLAQVRARVLAVVDETADTKSFIVRPNRHWRGHRAGQHVTVEVPIHGVTQRRSYSVSSGVASRDVRITVKRQSHSRVSAWLHDNIQPGSVLSLSPAMGEFGLPLNTSGDVLLLSAGSGITPMMAVLEQLVATGYRGHIAFVHSCRDQDALIFASRLRELAAQQPNLSLDLHYSARDGRMDVSTLAAMQPDFASRETLLCGPPNFMRWIEAAYAAANASVRLTTERFGFAAPASGNNAATANDIHCIRSDRVFTAGEKPLLMEAEAAGLQPRYGCRAGICRTCLCHKREGVVENLLTGVVSDEPNQWIQLCISVARSPLSLDL